MEKDLIQQKKDLEIEQNIECKIYDQSKLTEEQNIFNENLRQKLQKDLSLNEGLNFIDKIKKDLEIRSQFLKDFIFGDVKFIDLKHNVISVNSLELFAKLLIPGETTITTGLTKLALGTGTTPVTEDDTALETEVYRTVFSNLTRQGTTVIGTAFFDQNEIAGTYTEFGNFINDTILFSHLNTNWVKALADTLTISMSYTIKNV